MQLLQFATLDLMRRAQGDALGAIGFDPAELTHRRLAGGAYWRLRDYGGPDPETSLLIIAGPIKRPYIWNLGPNVSAIRYCLSHAVHVYVLERRETGTFRHAPRLLGMSRNTIRSWTPEQIELLRSLVLRGVSSSRASVLLKRSRASVQNKARELAVPFPYKRHVRAKRLAQEVKARAAIGLTP